jgi:hypothetical protein
MVSARVGWSLVSSGDAGGFSSSAIYITVAPCREAGESSVSTTPQSTLSQIVATQIALGIASLIANTMSDG